MFRRGRPFHPFRPPVAIRQVDIPPALRHANRLVAAGQYAEAASIFEQFARAALERNGPRAPWFLLQAGRCHLRTGQVTSAMQYIMQALQIFAARADWQNLDVMGRHVAADLSSLALPDQAQQVQEYLVAHLPALPGTRVEKTAVEKPRSMLPTVCPGCGAPMLSSEAEWVDAVTAECPYCGSAVRTG